MANKANSLAHTKWMCKYHIIFTPKYRRKVIYNQYRKDLGEILRELCRYKHVEIIEGHLMRDHVHMLVMIPPSLSVSAFMGYLKGKSEFMSIIVYNSLQTKEKTARCGLNCFMRFVLVLEVLPFQQVEPISFLNQ